MAERIVLVKEFKSTMRNSFPPAPEYRDKHGEEYWLANPEDDDMYDQCFACLKPIPEGDERYFRGWYSADIFCASCVETTTLDIVIEAYEEVRDSEDDEGEGV